MSRLLIIVGLGFFLSSVSFGQYKGKITKVYDGETFWVKMENGDVDSVRLWGVDAPELKQQYGIAAQKNLKNYIHKKVYMEYKTRDKNNYMLAIVTFVEKDGVEINLNHVLIEQGFAWKNKFSDDKKLEKLEKQARKNKVGLWRETKPTPPWNWRKDNR